MYNKISISHHLLKFFHIKNQKLIRLFFLFEEPLLFRRHPQNIRSHSSTPMLIFRTGRTTNFSFHRILNLAVVKRDWYTLSLPNCSFAFINSFYSYIYILFYFVIWKMLMHNGELINLFGQISVILFEKFEMLYISAD